MSYNILIVDDSKSMRKVILKTLKLSGFPIGEAHEASNGVEALEVLRGQWVDLILSDIHMPTMDGFELLRSLRKHENFSDLPVVIVTTEANEGRLNELMDLGARAYLRKPFRPEEMRSILCKVMGEGDESSVAVSDERFDF
jgi:two-component system chemotaxis response regulator CheY